MNQIDATNAWVFISHSNKDFDKILRVRNKLEALQYKPLLFFLKCLEDDKEIFELIKREIKARDRFILCDSKNSRKSEWVQKEKEFIVSLNRPYEVIDIEGSDEAIEESIERFDRRSTIYVWSTDDRINDVVVKKFVDKAYKVELLPDYYLRDYFLYKTGSADLVHAGFHDVMTNGYVLLLISRELSAMETYYIDMAASYFRRYTNNCCLYLTAKESWANSELYYELRNGDGIRPRVVCEHTLANRDITEVADKIVTDLMALDNANYNYSRPKEQ
jgi:hypothetical protein